MPWLAGILLTFFAVSVTCYLETGFSDRGECHSMEMRPEKSFFGAMCKERKSGFSSEEDPDLNFHPTSDATEEKVPGSDHFGWDYDDRNIGYYGTKHAANGEQKQMERLIIEQRGQIQDLSEIVKKLELVVEMLRDRSMPLIDQGKGYENLQPMLSSRAQVDGHISSPMEEQQEGLENQHDVDINPMAGSSMTAIDSLDDIDIQQITSQREFPHKSAGGMTVARYKPAWSDHFQFLSAVKVDGEITCLHILSHEGEETLNRYIAVGVKTGKVYVFLSHGDPVVNFMTVSSHPVTAMASFVLRRNETMLFTGHSDGSVLVHKLWQRTHGQSHNSGDDSHTLFMERNNSLTMDYTKAFSSDNGIEKLGVNDKAITILEVYRAGKMRYILAINADGEIYVFRENGTYYGAARSSSQPLAFLRSPNSQRLLFLTEHGVASLDLRSLLVQTQSCKGLNGTRVVAYSFDAAGRSRAYGFTAEGDIIYVALSGDTLHFECYVRFKKKLELEGAMILQGIKGYLLVATKGGVFVYNTSLLVDSSFKGIHVGMPHLLFAASMDEISLSFSSKQIPISNQPLMACNRENLVVLGFGDGYIGIYKSNLPSQKHLQFASKFWSSPIFMMIVILLGGWHFFAKRKDSLLPPATISGKLTSTTSQAL